MIDICVYMFEKPNVTTHLDKFKYCRGTVHRLHYINGQNTLREITV